MAYIFGLEVANLYLGYARLLITIFHDHQPVLGGVCERLKNSFVKMGRYFDNHPDDPHRSEVFHHSQLLSIM